MIERMSETPEISMDLLELEDVVPRPDFESVFTEEEGGEEEFLGKRMMWSGPRS